MYCEEVRSWYLLKILWVNVFQSLINAFQFSRKLIHRTYDNKNDAVVYRIPFILLPLFLYLILPPK